MTENNNDDRSLIETLVYEGVLPSFDLPTDVALFEAQKMGKAFGKIVAEHSVSKSLSSALNAWTPNRKLVIEKTEYKISGILIPFAEIPENDDSLTPSQQDQRKALAVVMIIRGSTPLAVGFSQNVTPRWLKPLFAGRPCSQVFVLNAQCCSPLCASMAAIWPSGVLT